MSRPIIKQGEIRARDLKSGDVILWREGASRRQKSGGVWREVATVTNNVRRTEVKTAVSFCEGYSTTFNGVDLVTIQIPSGEAPDPQAVTA